MKEKRIQLIEREKRCDEARKRNETMIEDNRKKILDKISNIERQIKMKRDENSRTSLEKFIEFTIKKENIEENLQQRDNAIEYQRLQRIMELEAKSKRIEEMRIQKLEKAEEKKKINIELQKSKESMMKKFETLKKSKCIKDKNELFSELFDEQSNQISTSNLPHSKSTRQFSPQLKSSDDTKTINQVIFQNNNSPNDNSINQNDLFLTHILQNNNDNDKTSLENMIENNQEI